MQNTPNTVDEDQKYSKLDNLAYFMKKGGILPYIPFCVASYLAYICPYNYTEAYQKGVAGIIDHEITQPDGQVIRLTKKKGTGLNLNSYIQDGTKLRTTTYETPEGNWFQNMGAGIDKTWRTRNFGTTSVEKILEDSGNSNTFGRAEHFELQPENLPSKAEIQNIITTLKELIETGSIDGNITIEGFSSPEGNNAQDLTTKSGDSFDKNITLASERAKYIKNELLKIPEIVPYLGEVTAVVNTLGEDDINKLYNTLGLTSLSDVHDLLRQLNRGEIQLSDEQNKVISEIFMRGVRLDYSTITEAKEKNTIDYSFQYTNTPFNEKLMLLALIIGLLMSGTCLKMNAHRKIHNAYMKNPDSQEGERAASFLGAGGVEEIKSIEKLALELGKDISNL